jgi:SAM-dependent methyltransferase
MTNKPAASYHDFVIKDGAFIGKFEDMYKQFDDPWMQSSQPNPYSRMACIQTMQKFGIHSVVEWGCGLGYYADAIHKHTGVIPKSLDISPSAIEKAKKLFPHLDFDVADISQLAQYASYDAILFAEITWYVLPELQKIFDEMLRHMQGKYFLHNLVFYKGTQRYGTEYFTNLASFIEYVPFKLLGYCEATTEQDSTIETHTVFRIEPK